jgi:hypothetical protein
MLFSPYLTIHSDMNCCSRVSMMDPVSTEFDQVFLGIGTVDWWQTAFLYAWSMAMRLLEECRCVCLKNGNACAMFKADHDGMEASQWWWWWFSLDQLRLFSRLQGCRCARPVFKDRNHGKWFSYRFSALWSFSLCVAFSQLTQAPEYFAE